MVTIIELRVRIPIVHVRMKPKINLIEALGSGHFWRLVAVWAIFGSPTQPIIFK